MKKYLILAIVLTSCGPSYHLKQSEKHLSIAKAKGAKTSVDSVFAKVPINIEGDSGIQFIEPEIDSAEFKRVIDQNDSLVLLIDKLQHTPEDPRLPQALAENKRLKARLAQGFSKDSTYIFTPNEFTEIKVNVKNGLVSLIDYKQDDRKIIKEVPVIVEKKIQTGYSTWDMIVLGIVIAAVIWFIAFIYWKRANRNS